MHIHIYICMPLYDTINGNVQEFEINVKDEKQYELMHTSDDDDPK